MSLLFKASISLCPYPSKPTSNDIRQMIFTLREINIDELSEFISKGHSICHVFTNQNFMTQNKTIKNFKEANFIVLDFDHSSVQLDYVIHQSIIKPSLAFETFSHSKDDIRFKLIYLIDKPIITHQNYKRMTELVFNLAFTEGGQFELRKSLDTTCYTSNQMIHGTGQNKRIESTHTVISIDLINQLFKNQGNEFKEYEEVFDYLNINQDFHPVKKREVKSNNDFKKTNGCPKKGASRQKSISQHDLTTFPHFGTGSTELFDLDLIYDDIFIKSKYNNYHTIQLSSEERDKIYYWVGNQDIYALNTYFVGGKQKVGARKRTLLYAAHVFCNLYPEITPQKLYLNLKDYSFRYFERHTDIDNDYIRRLANGVIAMDTHFQIGKKFFVLNPVYSRLSKSDKIKALHQRKRELMRHYVLSNHDGSLTLKQMADKLHFHPRTVKKYLDADGVYYMPESKKEDAYQKFISVYSVEENRKLSVRKLADKCGISKSQVQRYLKRYKCKI